MNRHGVRVGQHILVSVLSDNDRSVPDEIAQHLTTATPTFLNTATRMEETGPVERRSDPADARLVRLYLTPWGAGSFQRSAL